MVYARRRGGIVVPNDEVLVGLATQITYDIVSAEDDVVLYRDSVISADRVVAATGIEINIRAVSYLSMGLHQMLPGGVGRLLIQEGIVFGN